VCYELQGLTGYPAPSMVRISRGGPPKGPGGDGGNEEFEPGPDEEEEGGFSRVSLEDVCWFFKSRARTCILL